MSGFRGDRDTEPTISVSDAQQRILERVSFAGVEAVSLLEAVGRVLGEDVVASDDLPASDNSAMDGYAVRAADVSGATRSDPATLLLLDDIAAGRSSPTVITPGTASRIMTGGVIPPGADSVVQVEQTDGGSGHVGVYMTVAAGTNIRRRGDDVKAGTTVLKAGTILHGGEIGVLASLFRPTIGVGRRPTVAILATGNELAELGQPRSRGIANSNSYSLAALAQEAGGLADLRGIVGDSIEATAAAIEQAAAADFVVSTGGVSAGAYDFVKEALDVLGAETVFWRVAMKPGKPVLFATYRGRCFFGLPGNPVSAVVGFLLFVIPAIRKAAGQRGDCLPPRIMARSESRLRASGGRTSYLRVRVIDRDGELVAIPMAAQGSHVGTSLIEANGLAVVGEHSDTVESGELVPVLLIHLPFNNAGMPS